MLPWPSTLGEHTHRGTEGLSYQSCNVPKLQREEPSDPLLSIPHQQHLVEHSNSRCKCLTLFGPERVLVLTTRSDLAHSFSPAAVTSALRELGRVWRHFKYSLTNATWSASGGREYPPCALRYTATRAHHDEPLGTHYHTWKLRSLYEVQLIMEYFTLKNTWKSVFSIDIELVWIGPWKRSHVLNKRTGTHLDKSEVGAVSILTMCLGRWGFWISLIIIFRIYASHLS